MRRLLTISVLFFISACLWRLSPAQIPFVAETCSTPLPGPERAKAAAARVRPGLERDLAALGLRLGDAVFLRAFKQEKLLEAWVRRSDTGKYQHFRTWPIAALSGRPGPKLAEGDGQVPEGFYHVTPELMKPDSTFHLAFNIGFPNAYDRHHGRTGSFIMVHGNRVSVGCLAMTDEKIEEIYTLCDAALTNGQNFVRVHLFPFRMSDERMAKEAGHKWLDFWKQLREGYDHFERNRVPPEVTVRGGRYHFGAGNQRPPDPNKTAAAAFLSAKTGSRRR
jgi:murein L,D-transpeptidase YafK